MKTLLLFSILEVAINFAQESKVLREFSAANQQFTSKVYKELAKINSGNFLVCPLSVQVAISLSHAGARGETASQLAAGVNLPNDRAKILEIFRNISPYLQVNSGYTLTSANKLYVANRFKIKEQFRNTIANSFGADIENINFVPSHLAAAKMNKWVEDKTSGKIKDLIKEYYLDQSTVTVLINAMYFNANWLQQFSLLGTTKTDFFINSTHKVQVDMMHSSDDPVNYYESTKLNAHVLELPYEGNDVSMTIVLPKDKYGLPALEERIGDIFDNHMYAMRTITVGLPKFKIETSIDFKEILKQFGVGIPFSRLADFYDMGDNQQPVYISEVVQKTFIEVNEKGTTAGASTAVISSDRSFGLSVIANHPFIFYLKHRISGVIFVGRYMGPDVPPEMHTESRLHANIPTTTTTESDRFIWT